MTGLDKRSRLIAGAPVPLYQQHRDLELDPAAAVAQMKKLVS
jgi:hypothetical protein